MQIDAGLVVVFVPVLIALLGMAYGYGVLSNRVKANTGDIHDIWKAITEFKTDNKADHVAMGLKLDTIIRNGKRTD